MQFQSPVRDLATEVGKRKVLRERRHLKTMGQKKSKVSGPGGDSRRSTLKKEESHLPDIPVDSPLGSMIKYWDDWPSCKEKNKEKMIHYCMEIWGGTTDKG